MNYKEVGQFTCEDATALDGFWYSRALPYLRGLAEGLHARHSANQMYLPRFFLGCAYAEAAQDWMRG